MNRLFSQTSPCGGGVNRLAINLFVSLFAIVFFKCRHHLVKVASLSIELYILYRIMNSPFAQTSPCGGGWSRQPCAGNSHRRSRR